jgi:DNA-binding transcriptional regulator/RsmH inhibitor MraZ
MSIVKFQTIIEDGNISIPTKFRNKIKGKVEVIVTIKEKNAEPYDILSELMENPIQDLNFTPFKRDEIYDRRF